MYSALVHRITPVRVVFWLSSLPAGYLVLSSRRLLDLPRRGTQTDRSISGQDWTLPVHRSATVS